MSMLLGSQHQIVSFVLSVQMRLYTMHKREFVLFFAAFFACFGLCIIIGLAGPSTTNMTSIRATELKPSVNRSIMATGPFMLKSPTLFTYSQQLWITAQIVISNGDEEETFHKPFEVNVLIYGISDKNEQVVILDTEHSHNRTRELRCSGKICEDLTVLHLGFLDVSHYIITVRFYGLDTIDEKYQITDVIFHFKSYNPAYTKIEIWFRLIFLVATFFTACWFAHCLRHFIYHDWSIEQKWMMILLPLLLLYNDPIFPMSFLFNSWLPGMLDAMFQASFLCALLLFWLCIYHGIRQNKRKILTFYFPKCLIVGLLWIAAVTLASWQKYNELRDPTYNYRVDTQNFMGFKVFFFTVSGIYVIYLLYLIVKAYTELRSMPYFDVRLRFLTFLMLIVLSISIAITVLRFGTSVLEDNFVADLTTKYRSSVEFLSFYGLLNFYLYTMAYVYSPSLNAKLETRVKDNPTLSMIDDSDDEVIYGSDAEDRPLNPIHREPDKEESD